jgi:hypothetical protein
MITTRKELHDQIWSRPMTKVAADYGVTSTALKKTCIRHEIPTPERGYWAKLQYGKQVVPKLPLPPASAPHLETITIAGVSTPQLPAAVLEAEAAARARVEHDVGPVGVDGLAEPPILASTRRALVKARADDTGFASVDGKGVVTTKIAPASVERTLAFLTQLLVAAEVQGFKAGGGEDGIGLVVDGEPVAFAIEEQTEKSAHVPTAEDARRLADRRRWGGPDPFVPKYDHSPSGRLAILVNANPYSGLRRKFADGRTQTLETMIPDILVNLAAHAALIRERRREAEEAHKRQLEAEARRRLQEAFASREKEREAFIDEVHTQLLERAKLVSVLSHLEALPVKREDQLAGMLDWVKRRIAMIDALIGAHGLDLTARATELDFREPKDLEDQGKVRYYSRFQGLRLWSPYDETGTATAQTPYEWTTAVETEAAPPA